MDENNTNFLKKRIRALEAEESRLREVNERLSETLNRLGLHNAVKSDCEICKVLAETGY